MVNVQRQQVGSRLCRPRCQRQSSLFRCVSECLSVDLLAYDYVFLWRVSSLLTVYKRGELPRQFVPPYNVTLVTVLGYSAYAMWGAGFFGAMLEARERARSMGIVGHGWSGWAIGITLLVSFVGLVIPWLGFGEIRLSIIYSARRLSYG